MTPTKNDRHLLRYLVPGAGGIAVAGAVALWLAGRQTASGDKSAPAAVASVHATQVADGGVTLAARARQQNPIATSMVKRARLAPDLELVGSATFDGDRYAVVGPLIAGRVVTLRARPG